MKPQWRTVPGHLDFTISSDGQVWRIGRVRVVRGVPTGEPGRIVPQQTNAAGYKTVRLDNKLWLVHRLVALVWLGPPPAGTVVDHIDGQRDHNDAANLRYLTPAKNVQVGKAASLDAARVARIRRKAGTMSQEALAAQEGVSQQQVSKVIRGEAWQ